MKRILIFFIAITGSFTSIAQNKMKGKITYEYISGVNIRFLDMWFTHDNYLYQYRYMGDAKDLPQFKNKKYANVEDSLKDIPVMTRMNERLRKTPVQSWFGTLKNNEIIYSSFDNDLKTYCIKDTASFVQWTLLEDTLTIQGISCQKASGRFNSMNYTAWFAPSIPASVAPLQFRGLPGLLIKVINNTNNVTLAMINLDWPSKDEVDIQPCYKSPFITKQEMQSILNEKNSNILKMAEDVNKNNKAPQKSN
jgi:GLPGLI family protein